jgi:DNA-binding MarR family transcriptional regulator
VKSTAESTGKELTAIIAILKEKGIEATGETSLREIAEKMGVTPRDIYTMLAKKKEE